MVEKVTEMLIKVDLQCCRCYKKIKKILCEFPQIRDQRYNEKQNTVLITVVCCSPEKIRQKIICKGGETVESVEILPQKPPEKPKPEETKKPKEVIIDLPKETAKPPAFKPAPAPPPIIPPQQPPQPPPKAPVPVPGYPLVPLYPMVPVYPMVGVGSCPPCYGGYGGGPCYCGRRRPVMCHDGCGRPAGECQGGNTGSHHRQGRPVMCDDGCGRPACECPGERRPVMCDDGCGRPACECPGGRRGFYVSPCDYLSEENAAGCVVM